MTRADLQAFAARATSGGCRVVGLVAVLALSLALSCKSPVGTAGETAPGSSIEASAGPAASTTASAPLLSASAPSAAPRAETQEWKGIYKSEAGTFHVPDGGEWEKYTWRGADGGEGLGEGPLALTIEGSSHLVTGSAGGVIGDVVLQGAVVDGTITASVRRKDPTDRGLTGTLEASSSGTELSGTMRLAFGDAHVLREATFHLTRSPAP